ncbi:MAG: phospho-sugar mutase, partial [Spirochaetia bacterium]|nr:phospho-sugar mutase [Spirochaetia bacterium]
MQNDEQSQVKSAILDWAAPCFPLSVREEAVKAYQELVEGKPSEILDYYTSELKFGTGGLRGVIGNGPGRMNAWTVGKATVGFCDFLKRRNKKASVVIAHDSRRK